MSPLLPLLLLSSFAIIVDAQLITVLYNDSACEYRTSACPLKSFLGDCVYSAALESYYKLSAGSHPPYAYAYGCPDSTCAWRTCLTKGNAHYGDCIRVNADTYATSNIIWGLSVTLGFYTNTSCTALVPNTTTATYSTQYGQCLPNGASGLAGKYSYVAPFGPTQKQAAYVFHCSEHDCTSCVQCGILSFGACVPLGGRYIKAVLDVPTSSGHSAAQHTNAAGAGSATATSDGTAAADTFMIALIAANLCYMAFSGLWFE